MNTIERIQLMIQMCLIFNVPLFQVSSKVYNKVRNFSQRDDKRKNRLSDKEDKATTEKALDPKTRVLIYKLVNGGFLDSVNGVISMGKEAVIFHADGGPGPQDCHKPKPYNIPRECVLKVFKTTLNEFKTRDKYIKVMSDAFRHPF